MSNEVEIVKQDIEDNIFKIGNLTVGPLTLDSDSLVPFRDVDVSLRINPECIQDLSAIRNKEFEDRLKFKLGSMITEAIDEEIKSMDSRENTPENQNGHN